MMTMEWKLWPLLYVEYSLRSQGTNHHRPSALWKDARPDFERFDWNICRTDGAIEIGKPKPRMPWRLWVYWKDRDGVIHGWHIDWLWFPPRRLRK